METFDLSDVFARMDRVSESSAAYSDKLHRLVSYADFSNVPGDVAGKLARLGVVIDEIVDEYGLDTLALRCWIEMQQQLGISPCAVLSEMNDRFATAACELDVNNAVAMYAASKASGEPAACLDWNNNYGHDENKCILFHCGPVPQSMMVAKGEIADHAILANALGPGKAYGCNVGRITPMPFTFASATTSKAG